VVDSEHNNDHAVVANAATEQRRSPIKKGVCDPFVLDENTRRRRRRCHT